MFRLLGRANLLLALVVGVACAPAAPSGAPPGPAAKPAVPQTFNWGSAGFVPTLHPYISITGSQRRYDIYDTIIAQKADGSVGPAIATSWKTVDPTTWEFKIRLDMKFHDGTPMTMDDVKFSIDRANDPEKKYAITGRLTTFKDATVIDKETFRVTTKTPDPLFPKRIMFISVLPKVYLERVGDGGFQNQPIGTGPFKVTEWKENSHVALEAMPEHPFRKATLTKVVVRAVPEPSARQAGIRTGELDYVESMPLEQGTTFEREGFKLLAIDTGSSAGYTMDTVINESPTTLPTRDKRVRQAINYAIDKESIVKNIYRGYTKVEQCQLVQAETYGFNSSLKPYPYDPRKAKELLAAAGYPNGFKLEFRGTNTTAEAQPVALFVQSQLKEVGIDLDVQIIDGATYRDMFYGDKTRPGLFAHSLTNRPAFDADFALTWFAGTNKGGIRHYDNQAFDDAYLASQQEMNPDARLALLQKALAAYCEDPPYLFLVQFAVMHVYKADLQGVEKRADGQLDLSQVKRT